ncbi:hypothetical protein BGZ76_002944 [Entomortierella beljakovae]|nr:hypothetical protein BGZ76_002944 [Entomortierella beljakovae]
MTPKHSIPTDKILYSDQYQDEISNSQKQNADDSILRRSSHKKHNGFNSSSNDDDGGGGGGNNSNGSSRRKSIEHQYDGSGFPYSFNTRQDRRVGVVGIGDKNNEGKSSMERSSPSISSMNDPPRSLFAGVDSSMAIYNFRLEKAGIYLAIAALQAYTILSAVRCLADPTWIELTTSSDVSGGREGLAPGGDINTKEKWFLGFAIGFTLVSCIGVTLRILDKSAWLHRVPVITVITAYLQGYGNISPRTPAGRIVFFFFGTLGMVAVGFFILTLRNSVVEQLESQLLEKFSMPDHMVRVHSRMTTKGLSFSAARYAEEGRVKANVKRTMITRMFIIWIIFWFGGAGYVTLTTIGFGDYYPTQPGSIEFWNIYVLMGLTVFAYILSLLSDKMLAPIQLVDNDIDIDVDDEKLYAWEQRDNGDPNYPNDLLPIYSFSKLDSLGLDGNIWSQRQQERIHVYSKNSSGGNNDDDDDDMTGISLGLNQQDNPGHVKPQGGRVWGIFKNGGNSREGDLESQHPKDTSKQNQVVASQIRVFNVPAKRRDQMFQAEYYASHGTLSNATDFVRYPEHVPNMNKLSRNATYQSNRTVGTTSSYKSYAQRSTDRLSMISVAESTHSLSSLSSSTLSQFRKSQSYGALDFHEVMARRRRSLLAAKNRDLNLSTPNSSSIQYSRSSTGGSNYNVESNSCRPSPASDDVINSNNNHGHQQQELDDTGESLDDPYLKTNALQHHPHVHFETAATITGRPSLTRTIDTQYELPLSQPIQHSQQESFNMNHNVKKDNSNIPHINSQGYSPQKDTTLQSQILNTESERISLSQFPQSDNGTGSLSTLNSPSTSTDHGTYTEERTKMYERYLELENARTSHSSDTTKVEGSSPLLSHSPKDSFMRLNTFSAKIQEDSSSLLKTVVSLDDMNSDFSSFSREGIAPDELPPTGNPSSTLMVNPPPNLAHYKGESGFVPTRKRPLLSRLWSNVTGPNTLGLSPIREQKSWSSSSRRSSDSGI